MTVYDALVALVLVLIVICIYRLPSSRRRNVAHEADSNVLTGVKIF